MLFLTACVSLICLLIAVLMCVQPKKANADTAHTDHTGNWTQFTRGMAVTAGNYYLNSDVTVSGAIFIEADVTFCLNGYRLFASSSMTLFSVENGGKLTLCDCNGTRAHNYYVKGGAYVFYDGALPSEAAGAETGVIYGGVVTANYYGVMVNDGGSFTFAGGTIAGNGICGVNLSFGGLCVMEDGVICGNGGSGDCGGGVLVSYNTEFTMNGGEITDNQSDYGGGVYVSSCSAVNYPGGAFTLSGGTISDNHANICGGGIYMEDSTVSGKVNIIGGNVVNNYAGQGGDGVYVANGTLSVNGGQIGGGIYVSEGTTSIDSGYVSGKLYVFEGTLTIDGGYIADEVGQTDGSIVVSGGYFKRQGAASFVQTGYAFVQIDETTGDADYQSGYNYGVYRKGEIGCNFEEIAYDGSPLCVGEDLFLSVPSTLDLSYKYRSSDGALFADGLPVDAGRYSIIITVNEPYLDTTGSVIYYYPSGMQKSFAVEIGKATPQCSVPTGLEAKTGQRLSDIVLPEGWEWVEDRVFLDKAGDYQVEATYTPSDSDNYLPVTMTIGLHVSSSSASDNSGGMPGPSLSDPSDGLPGGAIAGIVIGSTAGVVLIAYAVLALLYKNGTVSGTFFDKIFPFIKK